MTKTLHKIILSTFLLLCSGCYPGISGKVVDGANGNPIEGAVVLAQWTKTHSLPGLTSHTVYKIEETETDKEGLFSIAGVYNPFVDPPEMVIYKKGYVPWRNDMDFMNPTWKHYEKNIWQDNMIYKLDVFTDNYTARQLSDFIDTGIIGLGDIPIFLRILNEISSKATDESRAKRDKRQKK